MLELKKKRLDKESLLELLRIVEIIKDNGLSKQEFINGIGKVVLDNGFGTSFVKPNSEVFNKILVNGKNDTVERITFFGDFDLNFQDYMDLFGSFRKVYVPSEDQYP